MQILNSIEPITLIWVSLERSFLPAELETVQMLILITGGTPANASHGRLPASKVVKGLIKQNLFRHVK